jgi:uncharacterized membrane protein
MLHWRLVVGAIVGPVVFAIARACGATDTLSALAAWNGAALSYLVLTWTLFLTASEAQVRSRAARQDEGRWLILVIVVVAICASLAAIVWALLSVKQEPAGQRGPVGALAVFTLVCSWAVLQTVFTLHYAHEHFRDLDRGGQGVVFPGQPARTYMDFVYLAVCVGATGQVSDPNITCVGLRNLVTSHGVMAFFYNTAVLALGINILASLLSG